MYVEGYIGHVLAMMSSSDESIQLYETLKEMLSFLLD